MARCQFKPKKTNFMFLGLIPKNLGVGKLCLKSENKKRKSFRRLTCLKWSPKSSIFSWIFEGKIETFQGVFQAPKTWMIDEEDKWIVLPFITKKRYLRNKILIINLHMLNIWNFPEITSHCCKNSHFLLISGPNLAKY